MSNLVPWHKGFGKSRDAPLTDRFSAVLSRNWWHKILNSNELYKLRLYPPAR